MVDQNIVIDRYVNHCILWLVLLDRSLKLFDYSDNMQEYSWKDMEHRVT